MSEIIKRCNVKIEDTWALNDIYASDDLWEAELCQILELCDKLKSFEGRLTDSADNLYNLEELADILFGRVYIYAN